MIQHFWLLKTPHFGFTVKRPQIGLQRAPSTLKLDGKCCKLSQKTLPPPIVDAVAVSLAAAPVIKTSVEKGINGTAWHEGWKGFGEIWNHVRWHVYNCRTVIRRDALCKRLSGERGAGGSGLIVAGLGSCVRRQCSGCKYKYMHNCYW